MKKKLLNYRHGDIALIGINELPDGLKAATDNILFVGSGGNAHSFSGGKFYPKVSDEYIVGYLVARNTILLHVRHGKKAKGYFLRKARIINGVYEVRRQVEHTNTGMKPVVD